MDCAGSNATKQQVQPAHFLLLYALAWSGGAIAYVPLLTILLPMRLTSMTGNADVRWLAYATFAGAVTASLTNIGFGWASDVTGNRRGWIAAGLALTVSSLGMIARVSDPYWLIAVLVVWQGGLNMMLAPLAAWAVDTVPDRQKGLLGGLLAFAPATGALAGVAVTMPGLAGADARVALVAAMVAASVLPALLLGRPVAISPRARIDTDVSVSKGLQRRTLVSLWLARTAVQTAEGTLFAFMLFYFRAGFPGFGDADVARIFSVVLIVAAPIALAAGRWVDRHDRKVAPLIISAALAALGLATMASAGSLAPTIAGYVLFGLAATVFLALHSSQTMRVLPNDARRARDLGIFNLANTLPSLWVPSLALMIVPQFGYAPLIWLLSGLTLSASLLLAGFARTPTR